MISLIDPYAGRLNNRLLNSKYCSPENISLAEKAVLSRQLRNGITKTELW